MLKGIQKGMNLPDEAVIPSFASLRDMGNTSSSTTWYTIAYLESQHMVKKGQQIMQVGHMHSFLLASFSATVQVAEVRHFHCGSVRVAGTQALNMPCLAQLVTCPHLRCAANPLCAESWCLFPPLCPCPAGRCWWRHEGWCQHLEGAQGQRRDPPSMDALRGPPIQVCRH